MPQDPQAVRRNAGRWPPTPGTGGGILIAGRLTGEANGRRLAIGTRTTRRLGVTGSLRLRADAKIRSHADERCREPGPYAARGRGRCLLHQSRHVGDALRRRPRQDRGHALRPRPVRGRGQRGRRRLRAHGGEAGGDPAPSRPRARQCARQPAQRQEGALAHGQCRGRTRDLSHPVQHAAHLRHRGHCPSRLGLGQIVVRRRLRGARRGRGDCRRAHAAGPDRDPDPARRYRLGRGWGGRRSPCHPRARIGRGGHCRCGGGAAARRRQDPVAARRRRPVRAALGAGRRHRRGDRLRRHGRVLQRPHPARSGAPQRAARPPTPSPRRSRC